MKLIFFASNIKVIDTPGCALIIKMWPCYFFHIAESVADKILSQTSVVNFNFVSTIFKPYKDVELLCVYFLLF